MTRLTKWGVSLLLLIGCLAIENVSEAVEEETYGIHIVKYRLEEGATLNQELPQDGRKLDKVTDKEGNNLQPLANVTYQLTKVQLKEPSLPVTELSSYQPTVGDEAFTMSLVTNNQGYAEINGLTAGSYQVEERPNETLKTPMQPIVIQLPMIHGTERLTQVYLYPKSSVVTPKTLPNNPPKKLPQTSGSIGRATQMFWMLGLITVMGLLGMRVSKQRQG